VDVSSRCPVGGQSRRGVRQTGEMCLEEGDSERAGLRAVLVPTRDGERRSREGQEDSECEGGGEDMTLVAAHWPMLHAERRPWNANEAVMQIE
jgi:hypothetical protein